MYMQIIDLSNEQEQLINKYNQLRGGTCIWKGVSYEEEEDIEISVSKAYPRTGYAWLVVKGSTSYGFGCVEDIYEAIEMASGWFENLGVSV